jgi:hypothetical protein
MFLLHSQVLQVRWHHNNMGLVYCERDSSVRSWIYSIWVLDFKAKRIFIGTKFLPTIAQLNMYTVRKTPTISLIFSINAKDS